MTTLHENLQPHITLDRVKAIDDLVRELVECYLCHGLLWHPVTCQNCDKTFCSVCIRTLYTDKSEQSRPHCCATYIARKISPALSHILAVLEVSCRYKSNGCTEILSYNELEQHEEMCDYQLITCNGCEQGIIKKQFNEHQSQCVLLLISCDQCSTTYKRKDKDLHTLNECIRIQLEPQKSKIEQLEKTIVDQQTKIDLIEKKLKQNDILWAVFFSTLNELKGVPEKQVDLLKTSDPNAELST